MKPNKITNNGWEERFAPSRPSRSGTRRVRKGFSRLSAAKAPSLDTKKQLAISVRDWSADQRTEEEIYKEQVFLQRELQATVHGIWQRHARAARASGDPELQAWMAEYEAARQPQGDETNAERYRRVEKWLKLNKPRGENAQALKWERQWAQLDRCQKEWVGYRASCCGERTAAIAVPIGCNHRLCPLCAYHRSQRARVRIKSMFDRLTHPVFLTLTIPNTLTIRKKDFTRFRQQVRKFIAEHKAWMLGGVYSLETTYNRAEKSWHIHCHVLLDASSSLPAKNWKMELAGKNVYAFTQLKLRLEFDWMRLWMKDKSTWGTHPRKGASAMRIAGDTYQFEEWVRGTRENVLRVYENAKWLPVALTESDRAARTEWNKANRRTVDIRPVTDREAAAREVLKYITKGADFSDSPKAVEQFMDAVKGARLIQTFGTWYGAKFDTVFDPEHMDDWGEMKCTCGLNRWERIGVFYKHEVEITLEGRWQFKCAHAHTCGGTVPRPMIRALEVHEE